MANKQQVIDLHRKHPELTSVAIAERLGCGDSYVRATFYRNGLALPGRTRSGTCCIYELGRAAKAAGLTVADINEIAAAIAS